MQTRSVELGKSSKERDGLAIELDAFARHKLERAAHATLTQGERGRKRLRVGLLIVAGKCRPHCLLQIFFAKGRHTKCARAGADGDGKTSLRARDQEKQGARRRLLKRFQE